MLPHLNSLLDRLGLQAKPRYTLEETADILGIRRDQTLDLLKRGKLLGVRASERRWGGVIAVDLDNYIGRVNAPRVPNTQAPSAAPVVVTSPAPIRPSVPATPPKVTPLPPNPLSIPPNQSANRTLPTEAMTDSSLTTKPRLNF